ncbi:MAG: hypothetical protein ACJ74S_11810, partial [Gaiellaceae bacterium]
MEGARRAGTPALSSRSEDERRIVTSAKEETVTVASDELRRLDAFWRAANYLSVGQIYLLDNPLLREPLR